MVSPTRQGVARGQELLSHLGRAVHFDLSPDSRGVYNETRYDQACRIATCQLFSQPRASGESAAAQVAGWSLLQCSLSSTPEPTAENSDLIL
jgi:hypothetical protein